MRAVVQRVASARVLVDDRIIGAIGRGLLVLVGVGRDDTEADVTYTAGKVRELRLFEGADGKPMDQSVATMSGEILVVSQFTLYGDASKGRRPSFIDAARPEVAIPLYERFVGALRARGLAVATGEFGADMLVEIHNDGPVTLILDRTA